MRGDTQSPRAPAPEEIAGLRLSPSFSQPVYWYHPGFKDSSPQTESTRRLSNPVLLCQYLHRSQTLSSTLHVLALYAEWASTYDADMQTISYIAPQTIANALLEHAPSPSRGESTLRILDVGCGTGLVGDCLACVRGWEGRYVLDGMDMVQNMLDVARAKNTYQGLSKIDVHDGIMKVKPESYAAVLCVGMIQGSVIRPTVVNHFLHALRRDGILIMTIEEGCVAWPAFEQSLADLEASRRIEVVSRERFCVYQGHRDYSILLIVRKR